MRWAVLLQLVLAVGLSGRAAGADYWPLNPSHVYHYQDDGGRTLTVTCMDWPNGMIERESACALNGTPLWWTWEHFQSEADGDVVLVNYAHYFQGAIDPDYMLTYSPALKFLELPLAVGRSWLTRGVAHGYVDRNFLHVCYVERAETVTVPYGTFEALVLVESDLFVSVAHSGTYYLVADLGAVILPGGFELVSVDGIVGVESTTWGELKALFR